MIYTLATKRGIGVEIWGTYEDLNNFYKIISKFWNKEKYYYNKEEFINRDNLISSFSYEIRKAKEGFRLIRKNSHFSLTEKEYYGVQITWVHFIFSLAAIKFNMQFYETNKFDISQFLHVEFCLEESLNSFDPFVAAQIIPFINSSILTANKYIYQYMLYINYDYLRLKGGKSAFKKLPELLKIGIIFTEKYKEYENFLKSEANRLNVNIYDLELDGDDIDFDNLKW